MPKTYRLGSSALVHAPGVVRFAIDGYRWKKDQPLMVEAIASWGVPEDAVRALLSKEIPYTVEGETVVFTFPAREETRRMVGPNTLRLALMKLVHLIDRRGKEYPAAHEEVCLQFALDVADGERLTALYDSQY